MLAIWSGELKDRYGRGSYCILNQSFIEIAICHVNRFENRVVLVAKCLLGADRMQICAGRLCRVKSIAVTRDSPQRISRQLDSIFR